jgi:hypothetical protein
MGKPGMIPDVNLQNRIVIAGTGFLLRDDFQSFSVDLE